MSNPFSYIFSCLFVLIAHAGMLVNVFFNGKEVDTKEFVILCAAVLGLDIIYYFVMLFYKQHTYTVDFMLLLVLNMSVIFQSCFGGVHLSMKHYITCIVSLIASRVGYHLVRDHRWIQSKKKYVWVCIGIMMGVIVLFTGSRSMWIDLGFITIQPSEFIKPLLVIACATSITEQQNKHKFLQFNIVWENIILFGITAAVCLLQWWCRDLGSIPTFAAIYAAGFLLRICYPKAKFSNKTLIGAGVAVLIAAGIGIYLAPDYVRARLFVNIWDDTTGNGYQQSQALIAIAEGGWLGKGPSNGFLHEVFAYESDIVFATICEEWGLVIALMTVVVILLIAASPLINPPLSYFHGTLCAGVCAAFTVQMALNIFGSCNLIPFTGVTIPFISMGGSSMATSGIMAGMLTAAQNPVFAKMKSAKPKKQKKVTGGQPA